MTSAWLRIAEAPKDLGDLAVDISNRAHSEAVFFILLWSIPLAQDGYKRLQSRCFFCCQLLYRLRPCSKANGLLPKPNVVRCSQTGELRKQLLRDFEG